MASEFDFGFDGVDESVIRRERDKARDLRKSQWWRNRIGQGRCYYCGEQFPPKSLTMDHLIPLARGGRSSKANLVPTCKECNNRKKTMLPMEWDQYMEQLEKRGAGD